MLRGAGGAARAIAVELVLAGVSRLSIINRSAARVPVATETLRPGLVVADVIPNPPRTQLLTAAEAAGCVTIDGLGMLVGQGILGIKYWAGIDADAGVMRAALQEAFS
jgi:shikimate dehydrogenase